MSCPACSEALSAGQDRCPACGVALAAPTEGALAPDLMRLPRERVSEIPAFRKREPAWKDEVRERVRHRKRVRSDSAELPLFREAADEVLAEPLEEPAPAVAPAEPADDPPSSQASFAAEPAEAPEPEMADLPLRPRESAPEADGAPATEPPPAAAPGPRSAPLAQLEPAAPELGWREDELGAGEPARAPERPAFLVERVQAAALDGLTLAGVSAVVVYFTSRAARVPLLGLVPAWPYVACFLAFFGLVYAAFFTGLTGQTLGKMALRLRVVDRAGSPPGHLRAALRAALGALGTLVLVGVAPVLIDPARRALHDRLLKTRVIRI